MLGVDYIDGLRLDHGENFYLASIIDKHDRLDAIKTPKLIFAGGSNLAFGLDSEKIEKHLGIPVVNLGLYAGLGYSFMLEELKHSVKNDDMVILSIEYFISRNGHENEKNDITNYYSSATSYYSKSLSQKFKFIINNSRTKLKRTVFPPNRIVGDPLKAAAYSRTAFNKYGDQIGHLKDTLPRRLNDEGTLNYSYWQGINEINSFNELMVKKNISVYYYIPSYPESEYMKNKEVLDRLFLDLRSDLSIDILNGPNDFILEDSLFYDTVYHLNKIGREKRTDILIELLNENKNFNKKLNIMKSLN